jgi:hypothetical protein
VVHQRGNLRVRVDRDKTAAELVAVADLDQPGVVFRPGMPEGQQLFEQDGDLLPVGRGQGIQLQRVLADRQFFSWVAPAIGRLMLAKVPPLSVSQVQIFGGT